MQGFAGMQGSENVSPARSLGRSRPSRRGAENAIGLARRRGGGRRRAPGDGGGTCVPSSMASVAITTDGDSEDL